MNTRGNNMKKVLLMYAEYGSGHKSIAEYTAKYIKENNKDAIVEIINLTQYENFIGKVGMKFYSWVMVKRRELVFDIAYELTDSKISRLSRNNISRKSFDNEKLRKAITDFNPDITISTHFFCTNMISYYNKIGLINSKIYTIITDYHTHEIWTKNHKNEDGYIVANDIVKQELIKKGVPAKMIYPYGLPLNIFELQKLDSYNTIYRRYNLSGDRDVYLFFGGSSAGSMYYYSYFKTICKLNLDKDIIFICGRNTKLKDKSDRYVRKNGIDNVKVIGYSTDVLNLMKISKLVITKPGGATVTECLEMKVPMLLVPGVGGQEKYNARYIKKRKYGLKVRGCFSFKVALLKLELNPGIITNMKNKLNLLSKNTSVEKINQLINKN